MIAEFSIKNYYSVRDLQTFSFIPTQEKQDDEEFLHEVKDGVKLLRIGIVYGANASGKTNLLRALDDFRRMQIIVPGDKLTPIPYVPFMLDKESRKESTSMTLSFYISGTRYDLSLSYDAEKILSEELYITESTKAALAYSRRHDTVSARPVIQFGTKLKLSKKSQQAIIANTINNATILAAFGKTNVEPSLLDEVYAFFSGSLKTVLQPNMLLSDFVKSALKEDTSEKLRNFLVKMLKLSDFNIVDMDVHEEKVTKHTELNFKHQSDAGIFTLPEELESIGTIRFMGMSVLLSRLLLTDNVVSIDEVESSIHYELVSYFIKVFLANSRKDSQLLITTHDINLMNEDFLRRDVLWSTDKMDSGATTLRRFSEMGLHKTQSIYNAYRQGKLGKLPFLGSIYLNLEDME
jgi:hypothetical protein